MGLLASKTPGQKSVQKLWLIWVLIINTHAMNQVTLDCIRFWVLCFFTFSQGTHTVRAALYSTRITLAESLIWKFLRWKRVLLISCLKTTGVLTEGRKRISSSLHSELSLLRCITANFLEWGSATHTLGITAVKFSLTLFAVSVSYLSVLCITDFSTPRLGVFYCGSWKQSCDRLEICLNIINVISCKSVLTGTQNIASPRKCAQHCKVVIKCRATVPWESHLKHFQAEFSSFHALSFYASNCKRLLFSSPLYTPEAAFFIWYVFSRYP